LAAAVAGACGTPGKKALKPRALVGLYIKCQPDDAQIFVDDRYMGTVKGLDKRPLKLGVGLHRLEIRSEGYFTHFAEVKLVHGLKQDLDVKLRKEPF